VHYVLARIVTAAGEAMMTKTDAVGAALALYYEREATTRQLEAIDVTLRSPATDWPAGELAEDARVRALAVMSSRTRRFEAAYLGLCQVGRAQEFWAEVAQRRANGTRR
jgi:hypothetical protein